jgi:ArsR family transcriptional regulator, arsenate/arsenite/antimonite-responsive transcriptional repressor
MSKGHSRLADFDPRMASQLSCKQFSAIAKALADPRRYGILSEVAAAGEHMPCSALKAACSVTAATISHHIKDLEAAGLIEIEREGKFAILRFRPDTLDAYLESLRTNLRPSP